MRWFWLAAISSSQEPRPPLFHPPDHQVDPALAVPVVLVVPEGAGAQAPADRYRFRSLAASCLESRLGQVWEYTGSDQVAEYETMRGQLGEEKRPSILSADLLAIADYEADRHRTVVHVRLFDLTRNFGNATPYLWLGRVLLFEEAVAVERRPGAETPTPQQVFDDFTKAFAEVDQRMGTDPRLQRFVASAAANDGKVDRELLGLQLQEPQTTEQPGELILFPFAAAIRAAADQPSAASSTPAAPPSQADISPHPDHPKESEVPPPPTIEPPPSPRTTGGSS